MFFCKNNFIKIILFSIMSLVLTGCCTDNLSEADIASETSGIFYPAISQEYLKAVYQKMASYGYTLLGYNNTVYTSCYWSSLPDKSEIPIDDVVGEELTIVYGNHEVFWSVNEEDLSDCTLTAIIYRVNGYDEDFRICIYYEKTWPMTVYGLQIFERLNGITLNKGSELYKDRLHLDQAAYVYDADNHIISLTMQPMAEFMKALFDGQFIEADKEIQYTLEHSNACSLYFQDNLGLVTQIDIYPEGYVLMRKFEELYLMQIDAEICEKVINMGELPCF